MVAFGCLVSQTVSAEDKELLVKSGEKIALMGDSITQAGNLGFKTEVHR